MPPVTSSPRERTLAYAAWVTICLVWGTTYLAIDLALASVPVALLAGLRWTAAGALLTTALLVRGERLPPLRRWGAIAVSGALMVVVGNGGVVWAQQYVASGVAAVGIAMAPFWMVVVAALLGDGEPLSGRTLLGLVAGFLGAVVLAWPALTLTGAGATELILGIGALQVACVGWALGTAHTKRHATRATPLGTAAVQMLLSGGILVALGTVTGEWSALSFTPRSAAALVYLAVLGSAVGYTAYVYALQHLPIAVVSLYAYVNPLIAVTLGTVLLAEPFGLRVGLATALILAGIAIIRPASQPGRAADRRQAA